MAGLNKIQLIGRLGKAPASRFTPTGRKVCTFSLAVNRRWKGAEGQQNEATDWFNLETWGRLADISEEYLDKGSMIYVEGRLQTDRYEKDGDPKSFTKVVVRQLQMLDGRGRQASGDETDEAEAEEPEPIEA